MALGTGQSNDVGMYRRLNALKARNPGLKISLSLGGWSFNDADATKRIFSNLVASKANRATFITKAVAYCRKYSLDGLDFDW
jgi:chitinase